MAPSTLHRVQRRQFLQTASGLAASAFGAALAWAAEKPRNTNPRAISGDPVEPDWRQRPTITVGPGKSDLLTRLSEHLAVHHGPVNTGIVHDGRKALLIDCGEGSVASALPQLGISSVEALWFTHHHRDQACGAGRFTEANSKAFVPEKERTMLTGVGSFWANPKSRWHLSGFRPDHMVLAEPLHVDGVLSGGQTVAWGAAKLTVISTPGHTGGSLSFLVETDGRRTVFCGDAIYDAGKAWDLFSLQTGYMKFLDARPQLVSSLQRIKELRPDALVPSHGPLITEPSRAIDLLISRLDKACERQMATCYHRPYAEFAGRPNLMPIGPGKKVPDCLRRLSETTWVLIAKDKSALVIDCGTEKSVAAVQALLARGEIRRVEGLWVTHYHNDHVDAIPAFQKAFSDSPCITDRIVADVIARPMAWRIPSNSPSVCRVDRATADGESWQWHEFKLTAYHFPGQTLYHAGLFVEGQGLRLLLAGDSFDKGGMADYCAYNRNWLGENVGYDRCLALIQQLRPTHIFHSHRSEAVEFTAEQCRFMRAGNAEREQLFGELVPWDHANYGLDGHWVRCDPYEQKVEPGTEINLDVVITNHSPRQQAAACRAILPRTWDGRGTDPTWPSEIVSGTWPKAEIPPKEAGRVSLTFIVPSSAKPGRYVVPIDLRYGARALPQFAEAIVEVR